MRGLSGFWERPYNKKYSRAAAGVKESGGNFLWYKKLPPAPPFLVSCPYRRKL
jgi:hypothetical protein